DLAAALLDIYEAQRIAGSVEPQPPALADFSSRVLELCRGILADRRLGGTHADALREWAQAFVTLEGPDFELLANFKVNMPSIKEGPSKEAVRELKGELIPALQAQWIEQHYQGLPALAATALERLDTIFRAKKRADSVLDFADLEEETIRLLE